MPLVLVSRSQTLSAPACRESLATRDYTRAGRISQYGEDKEKLALLSVAGSHAHGLIQISRALTYSEDNAGGRRVEGGRKETRSGGREGTKQDGEKRENQNVYV